MLLFLASVPYGPLLALWGFPTLGLLVSFNTLLYLAPLVLQRAGYSRTGRLIAPLVAALNVAAIGLWFGRQSQVHLSLFIFLTLPFQVFDLRREFTALVFPVVVCTLLFFWIQLDAFPDALRIGLPEQLQVQLRAAFGVGTMSVFALTLGYFYSYNQKNESALEEAVEEQRSTILQLQTTQNSLAQARDEAQRAAQAKSEFLSLISHELNTPLNGIIGAVEELKNSQEPKESELVCALLDRSSRRLAYLLRGLVDFVQIDRDGQYFRNAPFDLVHDLESLIAPYRAQAIEKKLDLEFTIDHTLEHLVLGDRRRVRQVMNHLVDNAIQYTQRGKVGVRAQLLEVEDQLHAQITIEDTGPGMSAKIREQVFDAFAQGVDSMHRGSDGLGLGLATTKKLLTAMDGTIRLEDGEEGGVHVAISFRLPLAEMSREELHSVREVGRQMRTKRGPRVLIAEDNPTSLRLIKRSMERLGYEVEATEDGEQALMAWNASEFDLLLLDIQMPHLDGLETARRIREQEVQKLEKTNNSHPRRGRVPIVFVTANTNADQEAQAWEIGIEGYLTKPCRPAELKQTLHDLGLPLPLPNNKPAA